MAVPLQNIYYLLCYAWKRFEAKPLTDVSAIPGNRVENLLAQVLIDGVTRLLRSGLDRGYISLNEECRTLRGKLLLGQTVKRSLLQRGQVACELDEFTHDVPHNRVIKAALTELIAVRTVDAALRRSLQRLRDRLHEVRDVELDREALRQVRPHRNIARYGFLMNVCELVAYSFLPESSTGRRRFHAFTEQPQTMGLIFQDFVRNFLAREHDAYSIDAPQVRWQASAVRASDLEWLPAMRTDMVLTNEEQRVIIEAKYYATPLQSHHQTRKLISGHLYQILTYVSQMDMSDGPRPIGALLYAMAGEEMRYDYVLGGHVVLVRSLNLNRPWQSIHRDLLAIASEFAARKGLDPEHVVTHRRQP